MDIKMFTTSSLSKFLEGRSFIERLHVAIYLLSYAAMWALGAPSDTPTISYYLTFFLIPLISMGYMASISGILFIRNIWYFLFCNTTIIVNMFLLSLIKDKAQYDGMYFGFELLHIVMGAGIGYFMPYIISFPFKILHGYFHNVDLYFEPNALSQLEKKADPAKVKEAHKFDAMNETQLNAELQLALKHENFEDAEQIKKILETKFR